ncbi:MAG: hypothetical protein FWG53_09070 [Clostridiales bacterium]|nr:hypothetical protein [Clostridiales bacterium]
MSKNTKKGFLSVEASIFVPMFVIAVLTIGYLIKVAAVSENVMHVMADEARKLSMYSYGLELTHLKFKPDVESRLTLETKDIEHPSVESMNYLYKAKGKDDLIGFRVDSGVKIKLPIIFYDGVSLTDTLFFRAFTGREYKPDYAGFDDMEEEEPRLVWVFPVAGERYHEEDCSYIKVAARQGALNSAIKKKYKPCSLCDASGASVGSVIYYFESAGEVYHQGSCFIVDRYVISMDEADAKKKGYTPCSKCT